MNYFADILKQFNSKQKVFILVILLFFTSITSIITNYLTSDYNSCEKIVKENRELLEDYIKISNLIKKQYDVLDKESAKVESSQTDSSIFVNPVVETTVQDVTMDSIMKIVSRHTK
jgi:phage regulator Rha-like protein